MNPTITVFFLVCLSVLVIVQCQPPEGCGPPPGGPPPGGKHGGPRGPHGPPPARLPACKEYDEAVHNYKKENGLGGPKVCTVREERDDCEYKASIEAAKNVDPATEECLTQVDAYYRPT